ncbi:hypothetical protein CKO38_12460 [Rhodospirillum rubrum]|uniref:hypothetical protein n=1 Tax=Rhodospirillum rubrum TaxID=1085 RepID=UPI0019041252|nr:hypothetical protein [Rhodospirillum rubrum]MBK1665618.1 hypothetical protein [Rhodospirillum rubrum]MBK1677463.1 hypothetical protein [Rhodospirillum rubrum]
MKAVLAVVLLVLLPILASLAPASAAAAGMGQGCHDLAGTGPAGQGPAPSSTPAAPVLPLGPPPCCAPLILALAGPEGLTPEIGQAAARLRPAPVRSPHRLTWPPPLKPPRL